MPRMMNSKWAKSYFSSSSIIRKSLWLDAAPVESVTAVEHEDLERGDAEFLEQKVHLVDVAGRLIGARW